MLTLSFTPFTDIFYRINERNEFTTYLWGGLVWNGINLLTFMFIGIVIFLKRREIDRPVRAIMLVIDIFPMIGCINDFFSLLDLSNIIVSVMTLIVFLLYEQNTTRFIIKNIHELENAKLLLAESRLSLEESKNQTLMAQIQPHFINNSLMALRARCAKYPDIYENITNFSMYLRSHFEALGDTKTISFEQEMTNIEAYLTLEQQNYKERLTVEYEIECDDFSKIFSDIVIYLKQYSANDLHFADGSKQNLFTKNGYYSNKYYASFVKKIDYINQYANEMIDNAIKQAENLNKDTNATNKQNQSEKIVKIKKS